MASILCADDDPWILKMVRNTLARRGHEVRTAPDGAEALKLLSSFRPDLIITDVRMPRMDGFAFVRQVRARTDTALVPVIFLSSMSDDENRLTGFSLGADDYVAKPFEVEDLARRIDRALKRKPRPGETDARIALGLGATVAVDPRKAGLAPAPTADDESPTNLYQRAPRSAGGIARRAPSPPPPASAPPPAAVPPRGGLLGSLRELGLAPILTILEMERKTGVLHIRRPTDQARLWLQGGRVIAARIDGRHVREGEDAVYALLGWPSGTFQFAGEPVDVPQTIHVSTTHILLEGARRADEGVAPPA